MKAKQKALKLIAELSLMPHTSAQVLDPDKGRGTAHGSSPPGGGRDWSRIDDLQPDYRQRSHAYFVGQARRCSTESQWNDLALQAQVALDSWRFSPKTFDADRRNTIKFKVTVANCGIESATEVARIYGVSRKSVYKWRHLYKKKPKATKEAA